MFCMRLYLKYAERLSTIILVSLTCIYTNLAQTLPYSSTFNNSWLIHDINLSVPQGTPLTEVTYLASFHAGSYGTKCDTELFTPKNAKWSTTPHTSIPGVSRKLSLLFLVHLDVNKLTLIASLTAIYGWFWCVPSCGLRCNVRWHSWCFCILGYAGSLRLAVAFLSEFATALLEENPKLRRLEAYALATKKFCTDLVAN